MATLRAAAAIAAGVIAMPASAAAAPTLQLDRPCYTPGEDITFTGTGYTPSGNVNLFFSLHGESGNNLLSASRPSVADAAGNIREVLAAPKLASTDDTRETLSVTANDETRLQSAPPSADSFGAAQTLLSTWDVFVTPWDNGTVDPRKKVKFRAYGFEPATQLWAHYVLGGRRVASAFVGKLTGPCGDLKKTLREFPFRPVPAGTYAVYFQGSRVFDKTVPWIRYPKVRVTKEKAVP
jgi:hypothetical protein